MHVKGCDCDECVARRAKRNARRQWVRENGPVLRDGGVAAQHLEWLSANGVTTRAVANACGINESYLARIRKGTIRRILARTEETILSVQPEHAPGAIAAKAHVLVLSDRGWTQAQIASTAGVSRATVCRLIVGHLTKIRDTTAERLLAVDPTQEPPGR